MIIRVFILLAIVLVQCACSNHSNLTHPINSSEYTAFPPDYEAALLEVPFCDLAQRDIGKLIALHGVLKHKKSNWLLRAGAECSSDAEITVNLESSKTCAGEDLWPRLMEVSNDDDKTANVLVYGTLKESQSTYTFSVTCFDYIQIIEPCLNQFE
jgi:hypothetical protein